MKYHGNIDPNDQLIEFDSQMDLHNASEAVGADYSPLHFKGR